MVRTLDFQSEFVIKSLVKDKNIGIKDATNLWYLSKTKKFLEDNNLYFASPARCYYELLLEMTNSPRWMRGSFE